MELRSRHPLTIRVLGKKRLLTKRKKLKKKSENYEQTICTSTRYGQNICEVSKRLAKNCRRSCAHKSIVDERTNGRVTARIYCTCVLTQVRQKLGFTGLYIIFLISAQNVDCEYSLEPPQSMFWAETWKISEFFIWKVSFFGDKIFCMFE